MIHKIVMRLFVLSIILIQTSCFASSGESDAAFAQTLAVIKAKLQAEGEEKLRIELGLKPGAPIPEIRIAPTLFPGSASFHFKDRHDLVRRTDIFNKGQVIRFTEDEDASVNNKSWHVVDDVAGVDFTDKLSAVSTRELTLQEKVRVQCCCFSALKNGATKTIKAKKETNNFTQEIKEEKNTFE